MDGPEGNNKPRVKSISLIIQNDKGTWYFGLLAAMLIILFGAIPGEFSRTGSKAYAAAEEEQIYKTQIRYNPMLLTSISVFEQQGIQQLPPITEGQKEMQQPPPSPPLPASLPQNATTIHAFEDAFVAIVNDTRNLSLAYQDEIAKLQSGAYDNQTFLMITDQYLQMYQQLLSRADALKQWPALLPLNYSKAIDLYSESIRTEMMSHEHFRNYISTGDLSENELSLELLSESLRFEIEAFNAFRSADNDTQLPPPTIIPIVRTTTQ
ncbi:MAG: hypothetical protein M3311_07140 [Thermoproteota archaeon]|nr:hypothetical protein [Thermoproteota archaeon]